LHKEARYILETIEGVSSVREVAADYESCANTQRRQSIKIYHGNLSSELIPEYGKGKPYHDYGNGFYATEDQALAKEWAVSMSSGENGYCHSFSLDMTGLRSLIIDAAEDVLSWMAILVKHRPGTGSRRWDLVFIYLSYAPTSRAFPAGSVVYL